MFSNSPPDVGTVRGATPGQTRADSRPDHLIGERLGPYRIESVIGRGGMGTVYRAVREGDDFRVTVAVKVVNSGEYDDDALRRFRTERQILSKFDHPYIGRMIDGGTTPSGLPYFVMEYVEGRQLHAFCDAQKLDVRARLLLFRKICEAVSYAHRHLIVHRDLKPGNILVTADGVPKLLDFGIAKLLTEPGATLSEHTVRLATPAYASPEQIQGGVVGTATDVYSLGVILYELLTGHSPYAINRGAQEDLQTMICDREPTRPSAVVHVLESYDVGRAREGAVDPTDICERRGTTPEALSRRLNGELENIIGMALRKEPDRRYVSVEQFSEDIRRHLEGLPIVARHDTVAYRTRKFILRHRWAVGAGTVAVLLLCLTTAVAVWNARHLAARVDEDHKLASTFLVSIYDSISKLPGSIPARQALLEKSLQYMDGLARDARSDASVERELALAYEKFAELQAGTGGAGLGQAGAALSTVERALAIRERLAQAHPQDRAMQSELANTYLLASYIVGRTRTQATRLQYDRKALAAAQTLVQADPANAAYQSLLARAHVSIAYAYTFSGSWPEMRDHLQRALAIRTRLAEANPANVPARQELANIHYRLGTSFVDTGEPARALEHLRKAFEIQSRLVQEQTLNQSLRSDLASTHHFLGVALGKTGEPRRALEHFTEAIAVRQAALEKDPRDNRSRSLMAGTYAELSTVQAQLHGTAAALSSIGKAVQLQLALHEVDPASVPIRFSLADYYSRLGGLQASLSHWGAAADAFDRSAEIYENLRAEGHAFSPNVEADADRVVREAARCERLTRIGVHSR